MKSSINHQFIESENGPLSDVCRWCGISLEDAEDRLCNSICAKVNPAIVALEGEIAALFAERDNVHAIMAGAEKDIARAAASLTVIEAAIARVSLAMSAVQIDAERGQFFGPSLEAMMEEAGLLDGTDPSARISGEFTVPYLVKPA